MHKNGLRQICQAAYVWYVNLYQCEMCHTPDLHSHSVSQRKSQSVGNSVCIMHIHRASESQTPGSNQGRIGCACVFVSVFFCSSICMDGPKSYASTVCMTCTHTMQPWEHKHVTKVSAEGKAKHI